MSDNTLCAPGAIPMLCCDAAADALDFYARAFDATEVMRLKMPDGTIGHAEILVHGARIMLSDEFPDWGHLSPKTVGGTVSGILIYVDDVDAVAAKAGAAGAEILMPPADQFYGDRSCKLKDPSGHVWMFATHIEDVPADEMQRRCDRMFSAEGGCGSDG